MQTETGLDYFGARYDASNLGRFMTPDWGAVSEPLPFANLTDPQSLNPYGYAGNNPLRFVDPDGHDYHVCGPKGKDCTWWQNDKDFEKWLRDNNLKLSPGGDIYTPANGYSSPIGNATWCDCTNTQQAAAMIGIGGQNFINAFMIRAIKDGVTGGVLGSAFGELFSGLRQGLGYIPTPALGQLTGNVAFLAERLSMLKPLVTDPRLEEIVNELYQVTDKIAGGTAAAVRYELMTGNPLSPATHFQEAGDIIVQLNRFLKKNPGISSNDQNIIKELIRDLTNARSGH